MKSKKVTTTKTEDIIILPNYNKFYRLVIHYILVYKVLQTVIKRIVGMGWLDFMAIQPMSIILCKQMLLHNAL